MGTSNLFAGFLKGIVLHALLNWFCDLESVQNCSHEIDSLPGCLDLVEHLDSFLFFNFIMKNGVKKHLN